MSRPACLLAWLMLCVVTTVATAHEVRPAYLELREGPAGTFEVTWKTPLRGDLRLALTPRFSGATLVLTPVVERHVDGAALQRWSLRAVEPLRGQTLAIDGLQATMTDALARIAFADGSEWVARLTPNAPVATVPLQSTTWQVAGEYLALGVEHILTGVDHLLFVFALLLLVVGWRRLVATVTAFTVAHSLTLAAATLGVVNVPPRPVEAVIALSIAVIAVEILHARAGRPGLTARRPWFIAFAFGLLHGLGFAGALAEIGLPEAHIPLALLCFNLGVELGQLLFVGAVLVGAALLRRLPLRAPRWSAPLPAYAIGSVAMFWLIQRVTVF